MKQITIKKMAENHKVTRQAVSQKIKRLGVEAYPELILVESDPNFSDRKILWVKEM